LHGEVPLLQLHVYGSIVPVAGCFPPAHGIPGEASSEFRDGGMIIDPWPLAREEKSWSILRGDEASGRSEKRFFLFFPRISHLFFIN
jgi:hypothetical protein